MTQEVERGRIKCHKYWPETPSKALEEGGFQLHLVNQQCLDYFHIKVIRMEETQVRVVCVGSNYTTFLSLTMVEPLLQDGLPTF